MALEVDTRWRIKHHVFSGWMEHRCQMCEESKGGLVLLQDSDTQNCVLACLMCLFTVAVATRNARKEPPHDQ